MLALFLSLGYNAQNKKEKVFTEPEQMAEYKGGLQEMAKFIGSELKYPKAAKDNKIGGKIFVKFIVDNNGAVKEPVILKGIDNCPECGQEALRVISSMPTWLPAKQGGKAVSCYYTIPIKFDPV